MDDPRDEPKPGDRIRVTTRRGKTWTARVASVLPRRQPCGSWETGEEAFVSVVTTIPDDESLTIPARRPDGRYDREARA